MPLCFKCFGSLGTHPAFPTSLLRAAGIDDVHRVDEVICEWAPRPASAHRVTEESGWFKPGAGAALVGDEPAERTVMLAALVKRTGESGRGCDLVLTLADDVDAATCVAAVRSQLTDESRLHHVTYEALIDACAADDPDLVAWAGRVRARYLDADTVEGRDTDSTGPRLGEHLASPDRKFGGGATSWPPIDA